jgi:hypothetical protein
LDFENINLPTGSRVFTFGAPHQGAFNEYLDSEIENVEGQLGGPIILGVPQPGGSTVWEFNPVFAVQASGVRLVNVEAENDEMPGDTDRRTAQLWDQDVDPLNIIEESAEWIVRHATSLADTAVGVVTSIAGLSDPDLATTVDIPPLFGPGRPIGYDGTRATHSFTAYRNQTSAQGAVDEFNSRLEYVRFTLEHLKEINAPFFFPDNDDRIRKPLIIPRLP